MTGHKDHFARTPTGAITPDAIKNLQRNMTTASYEDEHSMVEDARYIREHLPALLTDMHPDQNSRDLILTLAKTPGKLSQKPPTHLGSVALHYIVARARAWQHLMGSANLDTTQPMIRALFAQLKRLRVQWGNHVYIHGMGLRHEPKHGSDWTQDVTHWWEMLCASASTKTTTANHAASCQKKETKPKSSMCAKHCTTTSTHELARLRPDAKQPGRHCWRRTQTQSAQASQAGAAVLQDGVGHSPWRQPTNVATTSRQNRRWNSRSCHPSSTLRWA